MRVLGWDIGGVNTKAAFVADDAVQQVVTRPFELQKRPAALPGLLAEVAHRLCADGPDAHAVTMTAELSQMFVTKREGVAFVLDAVERAFGATPVWVYSTDGSFLSPADARATPLAVAAANWVATAHVVARHYRDALLVDVGTTTTDLIPICEGRVTADGRTDPDRLAAGELVYSGAVRTPVEAVVQQVPFDGRCARVSAEGFALTGDIYIWLGELAAHEYDASTPDGRPTDRTAAGVRLARVVCGDREMLDDSAITRIAETVARTQVETIATAIKEVIAGRPSIGTAIVTGLGAFLGVRAASAAGLHVERLSSRLGADGARSAPATAVALLLHESWADRDAGSSPPEVRNREDTMAGRASVDRGEHPLTVVKLGGSLLADPQQWREALAAIAAVARSHRLVVVPGGGPFADAVRNIDARLSLSDDAAHWMAIAGMDQHAEMIAASGESFVRVIDKSGLDAALRAGGIAVLAPSRWLREADPLPHSWDITSDSIAAWVAGTLGAMRLVVVKSAGASGPAILDAAFARTLPPDLPWVVCDASSLQAQFSVLEPFRR